MLRRQREGSIVCPNCGRLVGVRDEACLGCGTRNPSLWGFAPALRRLGEDFGFGKFLIFVCGALMLIAVAMSGSTAGGGGLFSLLAPNGRVLRLLGASGAYPVFVEGRWWSVLSAGWLHGGLLHIAFEVARYEDLKSANATLIDHDVPISHCTDHVSQRSIYFADPDGNRLEIYFEVPDALRRYAIEGRGDQDVPLQVTGPGEPLPAWLDEDWLARFEPVPAAAMME